VPAKTALSKKVASLPVPPSLVKTIGPSFILLGLALGSGELLLWPYLAANYGLGLLWGALLGISFQYLLNTEVMRYTLARGESIFVGLRELTIWSPVWFILSTFIPWSIPGFSSASASILVVMFPQLNATFLSVMFLVLTGLILTLGKTLYKTMETIQKTMVFLGIPFLVILAFLFTDTTHWQEALWGMVGRGNGWWFFPPGVALASFVGAFAYSGAGGNLNLSQTYYIKEKGFGMGKGTPKISSLVSGGSQVMRLEGKLFTNTPENRRRWNSWWKLILTEHALVFWLMGFTLITLLTVIARALVFGDAHEEGIRFLYAEATTIGARTIPAFGTFFLAVAATMLFTTQTGVLESSTRIISENILLLFYKPGKKFNLSNAFYFALWAQIILGAVLLLAGLNEPRLLLTLGAVLNAAAMMVAFPLIFWLNHKRLPSFIRAGAFRRFAAAAAFLCFLSFLVITAWANLA